MDRDKIGLAIIINNLHNEQKQTRNDEKNLKEAFEKIKVEVRKPKLNQDKQELEELADKLATDNFFSYNVVFLVIISHGKTGDMIVCQNKKTFDMQSFVDKLCENRSLVGQPKILLCDFCRGGELNEGETKSTQGTKLPYGADVFIGHATTKGFLSITGPKSSPFLQAFCDQIQKSYMSTTFQVIFQRVQQKVSEISTKIEKDGTISEGMQIPESKSTLRMDLFLVKQGKT